MKKKSWILSGLIWGMFMFIFTAIILPIMNKEVLLLKRIIIGFFLWLVFGLIFGKINERITNKRNQTPKKQFEQLDEGIENIDYMPDNEPESYDKKMDK
ncbi:MAG: hypothetical protein QM751_00340 [Paludibacteraceae bacterium]